MEKKELFEFLTIIAVPWGFHLVYCPDRDIVTIQGHADYATDATTGFIAGLMGARLVINWTTINTEQELLMVWRHFLCEVLRTASNALESGELEFSEWKNGVLVMNYIPKSQKQAP